MTNARYTGRCFCGEVEFEVTGAPAAHGLLPLRVLPPLVGGPGQRLYIVESAGAARHRGATSIGTHNKTPVSYRKWCTKCGGHLFTDHPPLKLVDVYAAMIPQLKFEPALHVHYQETVLRINDGKPKMKDMPKEMGGSGVLLPE